MDELSYRQLKIQKTSDEMDEDEDLTFADWQYGYDCVVKASRDAVARIAELEADLTNATQRIEVEQAIYGKRIAELESRNDKLEAENAKLRAALNEFIYETTHLSPLEDDGSHWCNISKSTLANARAAAVYKDEPTNADLDAIAPF